MVVPICASIVAMRTPFQAVDRDLVKRLGLKVE